MNAVRPIVLVLRHRGKVGVVFRFGFVLHFQDVEQSFQFIRLVVANLFRVVAAKIRTDSGNRGIDFAGLNEERTGGLTFVFDGGFKPPASPRDWGNLNLPRPLLAGH